MSTEDIEKVDPEEIFDEIREAALVHAAATNKFTTEFSFYGKSLDEWSNELAVPVPDKIDPDLMRQLYVKLANNIQVATHFYTVASTVSSSMTSGSRIKKADLVAAIVDQYEKGNATRPAATVIERMADSYMSDTQTMKIVAKIVKDFWRQKLDSLIEVRRCLEQIGISIHTEMKYVTPDAMPGYE